MVANLGSASTTLAAAPIVSLQKVLEKCEPTVRPLGTVKDSDENGSVYLILIRMLLPQLLTYVGIYPCDASCKMRGSCQQ